MFVYAAISKAMVPGHVTFKVVSFLSQDLLNENEEHVAGVLLHLCGHPSSPTVHSLQRLFPSPLHPYSPAFWQTTLSSQVCLSPLDE